MGKGNIFVLIEIEKKTTTKALMLKPCSHKLLISTHKLYTLYNILLTRPHSLPLTPRMIIVA